MEPKKDPVAAARDRFEKALEYWSEDRKEALEDIRFRAGQQWPEALSRERIDANRPCLVVDKLNQYVRQIVNDGRQNRPSLKVLPADSRSDVATAQVFQGMIRHIEVSSNADMAYDTALDGAATCGRGYFRVLTQYAKGETFEQEVVIRRIRNPLSVVIDPAAQEADLSDMRFAFVLEDVPKETFKAEWPKADMTPWDGDTTSFQNWFGETVRVAEYWWVEETEVKYHRLADGSVVSDEQLQALVGDGDIPAGVLVESRGIPKRVVKWCKMTGKEYLEKPTEWPGQWIPIFGVLGNEIDIEGKVCYSGIIRPGKDAQRLYNYSRSAFAERVALTPKAPWVAAEGQTEDYAHEWNTANVENHSVLRYKPTSLGGQPVPPPMRQSASDIPQGFAQDMQLSEHDIQGAIGMYNASLGAPSNERSGKAIMARQREGDVGTFHYHDNLNRAIRHLGRVLVDLLPKVYDTPRVVRILGYDGKEGEAALDPQQQMASVPKGVRTFYNLGVGKYDVILSTGPSYSTLRQEAASAMMELIQANPALMQIAGDLVVKNMDWPGAEELSARLKITLPPEIKEAEAQQATETASPEVRAVVAQFTQALQQKDQMMEQASDMIEALQGKIKLLESETEVAEREVRLKALDTKIKAYDAETKRLQVVGQALSPEQIQVIVMQTLQDLIQPNIPIELESPMPEQEILVPQQGEPADAPPQGVEQFTGVPENE